MANYHIHVDGQSTGPFTEEQLREQHAAGKINDETLVWVEDSPDWVAFKELNLEKPKIQLRRAEAAPPSMPAGGDAGLQFEHAQFTKPVGPAVNCSGCKTVINDVYYDVNGQIVCAKCHDGLKAALKGGSGVLRFVKALGAGLVAAVVGAAIWYAILKFTGYQLGIIAIAVGLLVGFAVRWGSEGRGGWKYQLLAMALTYCAIAGTYVPFIIQGIRHVRNERASVVATNQLAAAESDVSATNAAPAAKPVEKKQRSVGTWVLAYGFVFAWALASPFLPGIFNVIGLIIIGIALYEAWKINRRAPIAINGPFRVGVPRPAAS